MATWNDHTCMNCCVLCSLSTQWTELSSSVLLNFHRSSCHSSNCLPKSLGSFNNCLLMAIEIPGSAFIVPMQMGHRWEVKISVFQEPNNFQYTPNLVQKWWSRAVLTALTGGCAPTEWAAPFLPAEEELQLRMVLAVGEVCAGGRVLLLLKPWTHSWEGTGSQPSVCQINPAPFVMWGPSLSHMLPFWKK